MKIRNSPFTMIIALALLGPIASCRMQEELPSGEINHSGYKSSSAGNIKIESISVVDNQLIIEGSGLSKSTKILLKGTQGYKENFSIKSKSSSRLVAASATKNIAIAIGSVFDLIISDAYGSATFNVTFNLQNGTVTASKLHHMGASTGQVLRFNGTQWAPADLGGLVYRGAWDASSNTPDLLLGGNSGEYYIVGQAGATDLMGGIGTNNWLIGDWVVWNDTLAQWEKINNSSSVSSFNGRSGVVTPQSGDYTWAQINKSTSSISDIADVDTTGVADGKVLKWNSGQWVVGDDLSGGGAGSVTSAEIQDGSIANVDISATAAIAWSKIDKTGATAADVGAAPSTRTISAGTGLTGGGDFSANRSLAVDVGTGANKIVQLDGSARLPAIDGSLLTNLPAPTGIVNSQISGTADIAWSKISKTGAVASDVGAVSTARTITAGTGLTGGGDLSANRTLAVDVGTGANKIVQLDGSGRLPAVNASLLTNVPITSRWSATGSDIYYDVSNGKVGVGTNTPTSKLQVLHNVNVTDASTVADYALMISSTMNTSGEEIGLGIRNSSDLTAASTPGAAITLERTGTNSYGNLHFKTRTGTALDAPLAKRMTIMPNGNIGIGTSTPSQKVHVIGNTFIDGMNSGHTLTLKSAWNGTFGTGSVTNGGNTITGSGFSTGISVGDIITLTAPCWQSVRVTVINSDTQVTVAPSIQCTTGTHSLSKSRSPIRMFDFYDGWTLSIDNNANIHSKGGLLAGAGSIIGGGYVASSIAPTNGLLVQGNVGIGTNSPSYTLHVNGSVAGTGAYNALSDQRFKTNVKPLEDTLSKIKKVRGVTYVWRHDEFPEMRFEKKRQAGVIAQEVAEVFPLLVSLDETGVMSVAYSKFIPVLIEGVKELDSKVEENLRIYRLMQEGVRSELSEVQRKIASLESANEELKRENESLNKRLEKLEKILQATQAE